MRMQQLIKNEGNAPYDKIDKSTLIEGQAK